MKSLNKKISAIVLAGMVVMGGVVSSGVSSFAASANKVSVQENYQYKKVKNICKEYGNIIGFNKDEKNLEKGYKGYDKKKCYNNGHSVKVKNPYQIPVHLSKAKNSGKEFVKIEFYGLYYLIQLN